MIKPRLIHSKGFEGFATNPSGIKPTQRTADRRMVPGGLLILKLYFHFSWTRGNVRQESKGGLTALSMSDLAIMCSLRSPKPKVPDSRQTRPKAIQ
jgi:hypothetical protein